MKTLTYAFIVLFLAGFSFSIGSCTYIDVPGSYTLDSDIVGSNATLGGCIKINISGVTLDCGGKSITNNGSVNTYAIFTSGILNDTVIQNCNIYNYSRGIYTVSALNRVAFSGNNFSNCSYGILATVSNGTVSNNLVTYGSSTNTGISIAGNNDNITNNSFYNSSSYTALSVSGSSHLISGNYVYNSSTAGAGSGGSISITASNSTIRDNVVNISTWAGIYVTGDGSIIINNTATMCSLYPATAYAGLSVGSNNNLIANNTLFGNKGYGFYAITMGNSTVVNNTAFSNNASGFYFAASYNNTIANNTAYDNRNSAGNGMLFAYGTTRDREVSNNLAYDNSQNGFSLSGSASTTQGVFFNNTAYGNGNSGFYLTSYNINLTNCTSHDNNGSGVYFYQANNNTVYDSDIYGNKVAGAYMTTYFTDNNVVLRVHFYNNSKDYVVGYDGGVGSAKINITDTIFDNPLGNYQNFTNLSLYDIMGTSEAYYINWSSNTTDLPRDYFSFEQKYIDIRNNTNPIWVNITNITWHWSDSESATYDESAFELWRYNRAWTRTRADEDMAANTFTISNMTKFGIFGILQNNNSDYCYLITQPGSYAMNNNNIGAPNDDRYPWSYACIKVESSNVVFDCNGYNMTGDGIQTTTYGIVVTGGLSNVTIRNCPGISNYSYGVYVYNSSNVLVTNVTSFKDTNSSFVVNASSLDNLTNCTAYNSTVGVLIYNSTNISVSNITAYNSTLHGFVLNWSANNTLSNCSAYTNVQNGFYLSNSSANLITNNSAYNNTRDGFLIESSNYTLLIDNFADTNSRTGTSYSGYEFSSSWFSRLENNTARNSYRAFYFTSSPNSTLLNNSAYNCSYGATKGNCFEFSSSPDNNLTGNNGSLGNDMFIFTTSPRNTFINNFASNSASSYYTIIFSTSSGNNTVINNSVVNGYNGFWFAATSHNNTIVNNSFSNGSGGAGFYMDSSNNTVINNSAWNNNSGGYCFQINGAYNNVANNSGWKCQYGFWSQGNFNNFTNCTAYQNQYGIYLYSAQANNNTVIGNSAFNNTVNGFYLAGYNETLINNTAFNNTGVGFIFYTDTRGLVLNNTAYKNSHGFQFSGGSNYTIVNSTSFNNSQSGFYVASASSNFINFTNNAAYKNSVDGFNLAYGTNTSVIGNLAYNNSQYGFEVGTNAPNDTLINNSAYNNTQHGFYSSGSREYFLNNTAQGNNQTGFYVTGAGGVDNVFINNTAYNNTLHGFHIYNSAHRANLTNNSASNNRQNGIFIETSTNVSAINNTASGNLGAGIYLKTSNRTQLVGGHYYNNGYDLNFSTRPFYFNVSHAIIDNPAGNYSNYTDLSIDDNLNETSAVGYSINWSYNKTALPAGAFSFEQKFIDMVNYSGVEKIDSITWAWNQSEVDKNYSYREDYFEVWKRNNTWTKVNATLDTDANTLTATNLSSFSTFGILQNASVNCPIIYEPGNYTMPFNYTGAPNNASPFEGRACVKIIASNVSFDCNGSYIAGNTSGNTTYGIEFNSSVTNVTVINCPNITNYTYDVFIFNSTTNFTNVSVRNGYFSGFYLLNSTNNTITNFSAIGNNVSGIYVNSSSFGAISLGNASNNTLHGVYITDYTYCDIFDVCQPTVPSMNNSVYNLTMSNNGQDGLAVLGPNNTFYNNFVQDNARGLYAGCYYGNLVYNNYFNNTENAYVQNYPLTWSTSLCAGGANGNIFYNSSPACLGGNFWSDFIGWDTTGDYVGDTYLPYSISYGICGPPGIGLVSPENGSHFVLGTNLTFHWNSTDNMSNALTCRFYLDGALNGTQTIQNHGLGIWNLTNLSIGKHSWYVNCTDSDSLAPTSATWAFFMYNDSAVSVALNYTLDGQVLYSNESTYLNWTPVDNLTAAMNCSVHLDNISLGVQEVQNNTMGSMGTNGSLAEGVHNWSVRCEDYMGNFAEASARFSVATTSGLSIFLLSPQNGSVFTNTDPVNLNWNVSSNSSATLNCTAYLNGSSLGEQVVANASIGTQSTGALAEQNYTWYVNCTDANNNTTASGTWAFKVGAPLVILQSPGSLATINGSPVNLNWSVTDDDSLSMSCTPRLAQYTLASVSVANGTSYNMSADLNITGLIAWSVSCIDSNGVEGSANSSFFSNLSVQQTHLIYPFNNSYLEMGPLTFSWNASDNMTNTLSCELDIDNLSYGTSPVNNNGLGQLTVTNLTLGAHNWTVNCTGGQSNAVLAETWFLFLHNSSSITVSLDYPPASAVFYDANSIGLNWTPVDAEATAMNCSVYLDNISLGVQEVQNNTSANISSGALSPGLHYWNATCNDSWTNSGATNSYFSVASSSGMAMSLVYPANNAVFTRNDSIPLNWTGTSNVSSLLECQVFLDSSPYAYKNITNGTIDGIISSSVSQGNHSWFVNCSDGNGASIVSQTWNFVAGAPSIVLQSPANGASVNASEVKLNWSVTDDGSANVSCELFLDSNSTSVQNVSNGTSASVNASFNSTNLHYWNVTCTDSDGVLAYSETRQFFANYTITIVVPDPNQKDYLPLAGPAGPLSNLPPDVILIDPPNGHVFYTQGQKSLTWKTVDDRNTTMNCTVYLNGSAINTTQAANNTNMITQTASLSWGTYRWNVTCMDQEGQTGYSSTWLFNITTPPELNGPAVNLIDPPNGHFFSTNGSKNLTWNTTDDTSLTMDCTVYLNGSAINTTSAANNTNIVTQTASLGQGTYYWNVTCTDQYSNSGNSATWNFTIDTAGDACPGGDVCINLLDPPNNATFTTNTTHNLTWNVTDDWSSELNCSAFLNGTQVGTNQIVANGGNGTVTTAVLNTGFYIWNVSCADQASNLGYSETWNFTVDVCGDGICSATENYSTCAIDCDANAPLVNLIDPLSGTFFSTNGSKNLTWNTTDDTSLTMNCTVYLNGSAINTTQAANNTNIITQTASLGQGVYYWNVTCTDQNNNPGFSATWNFTIDTGNDACPGGDVCINLLQPPSGTLFTANTTHELIWNVTDDFSPTMQCNASLNGAQAGTTQSVNNGSNGSVTTAVLNAGFYLWNVTCWDNSTTRTSVTWNFTVEVCGDAVCSGTENCSSCSADCGICGGSAPTVNLVDPLSGTFFSTNGTKSLTWNVTDDLSPTMNCTVYLNGSIINTTSAANNTNIITNTPSLGQGTYRWNVTCVDDGSNSANSATWNFTIDTGNDACPNGDVCINLLQPPPGTLFTANTTHELIWNVTDDFSPTMQCNASLNGAQAGTTQSVNNGSNGSVTTAVLNAGFYLWNVTCWDNSTTRTSVTWNFTVQVCGDAVCSGTENCSSCSADCGICGGSVPTVNLVDPLSGTFFSTNGTKSLTWNVTDDLSPTMNCTVYLNGSIINTTSAANNTNIITNTPSLGQGTYRWNVTCVDDGSNSANSATWNFTIDTGNDACPNGDVCINLLQPPSGTLFTANTTHELIWNVTDDFSPTMQCNASLNGAQAGTTQSVNNGSNGSVTTAVLNAGFYLWNVTCWDNSTTRASATWNFTVQVCGDAVCSGTENCSSCSADCGICGGSVPTVNLVDPLSGTFFSTNGTKSLTWNVTDDLSPTMNCTVYLNGSIINTTSAANNTNIITNTPSLGQGTYRWNVTCVDDGSNSANSATWNFTIDTGNDACPNGDVCINLLQPPSGTLFTANTTHELIWNVTDDFSPTMQCNASLNGAQAGTTQSVNNGSNGSVTTAVLNAGFYLWNVTCWDNSTTRTSVTWNFTVQVCGNSICEINENCSLCSADCGSCDITGPTVVLNSPPNGIHTTNTTIDLNFTATDDTSLTMNCTMIILDPFLSIIENNVTATNNTPQVVTAGLAQGLYYWNVTCRDQDNNPGYSATWNFTIDTGNDTCPGGDVCITLISPPDGSFFNSTASKPLVWTVTDDFSPTLDCNVSLDGSQVGTETVNSSATGSVPSGIVSEGPHYWDVNCTDNAGTTRSSVTWLFTVDLNGPVVKLMDPPNGTMMNNSLPVTLTYNVTDDFSTPLSCDVYLNGTLLGTQSVANGTSSSIGAGTLALGTYYWNVTCTDLAGNQNSSETWQFTIDSAIAPIVILIDPPNDHYFNTNGSKTLTYNATDDNSLSLNCSVFLGGSLIDTATVANGSEASSSTPSLGEGIYSWNVTCTDENNNVGYSTTWLFTIDTVNDTNNSCASGDVCVDLLSPANGTLYTTSDPKTLTWTVTDDFSTILPCDVYLNGSLIGSQNVTNGSIGSILSPTLDSGTYPWNVTCMDDAGNIGYSQTWEFTIEICGNAVCGIGENCSICETDCGVCDTTSPNVVLNLPINDSWLSTTFASLNFTATDDNSTSLDCTMLVTNGSSDLVYNLTAQSGIPEVNTAVGLTLGPHYWNVTCTDDSNNTGYSVTWMFTIDTGGDIVVLLASPQNNTRFTVTGPKTLVWNVTDSFSPTLNCSVYLEGIFLGSRLVDNGTVANISTSSLSDGSYLWNVTCVDLASNFAASETWRFTINIEPPPRDCGNGIIDYSRGEECEQDADCGSGLSCDSCKCVGCGDGVCDSGESCSTCSADCGTCPSCGDGIINQPSEQCELGISCTNASLICRLSICQCVMPFCGDGECNGNESCTSCSSDCGSCQPQCGDTNFIPSAGQCDATHTCANTSLSCNTTSCLCVPPQPYCGDGNCTGNETCTSCSSDCGTCPPKCIEDGVCNPLCTSDPDCCTGNSDCGSGNVCSNGTCIEGSGCSFQNPPCGICQSCSNNACVGINESVYIIAPLEAEVNSTVEATLFGENGSVIPGSYINVTDPLNGSSLYITDANGSIFYIAEFPGYYNYTVPCRYLNLTRTYVTAVFDPNAPLSNKILIVPLYVTEPSKLTVDVVSVGRPLKAGVNLEDPKKISLVTSTDAAGHYEDNLLLLGNYTLTLSAQNVRSMAAQVNLSPLPQSKGLLEDPNLWILLLILLLLIILAYLMRNKILPLLARKKTAFLTHVPSPGKVGEKILISLYDQKGKPMRNVALTIIGEKGQLRELKTDEKGEASFIASDKGTYSAISNELIIKNGIIIIE